jgi:hypothetical protein
MKDLGKVAYDAYAKAYQPAGRAGTIQPVPWDQAHPQTRAEWNSAAQAVHDQMIRERYGIGEPPDYKLL